MEILNKELENFEYAKRQDVKKQTLADQYQHKQPQGHRKPSFKTNMAKSKRLNEMSIFISKDKKKAKRKVATSKNFKLEDMFMVLINDTKDNYQKKDGSKDLNF